MPRERSTQPAYQYHVSGQARVTLGGKDFYLGKYDTPESRARYHALLSEYNATGKQAPTKPGPEDAAEAEAEKVRLANTVIRIKHITADFRARVLPKYESNLASRSKYENLCDFLDTRHGDEPASDFGPLKLAEIRDIMVTKGIGKKPSPNSRKYANAQIKKVIAIIKHGVARQLINPENIVALQALAPLTKNEARDNPKRRPVPLETVRATLPFLSTTVAALVRLQLATAMRPGEMFQMTPAMIDRSGPVWIYTPDHHKTEDHDIERRVPILGEAVEVLAPYLFGDADALCFLTTKGTSWNKDSYRVAVARAAKAAKVGHWVPYQIRHLSLQTVRDQAGPEAAQALAGHSRLSTTEIYAGVAQAKAIEAARVAPRLGTG